MTTAQTKACKHCGLEKSLHDFHRQTACKDGHRHICKLCANAVCRKYYANNTEKAKTATKRCRMMTMYGMSLSDYERLLQAQGMSCAICRTKSPGGLGRFHVDHCHSTGRIRGLLCHSCNTGLGLFKDSDVNLRRAIEYLRQQDDYKP